MKLLLVLYSSRAEDAGSDLLLGSGRGLGLQAVFQDLLRGFPLPLPAQQRITSCQITTMVNVLVNVLTTLTCGGRRPPRLTRVLHQAFRQTGVRFRGRSQRIHGVTWCILGVFSRWDFELRLAGRAFLRRGGLDLREELQGRVLLVLVQVRCANRRNHLENTRSCQLTRPEA